MTTTQLSSPPVHETVSRVHNQSCSSTSGNFQNTSEELHQNKINPIAYTLDNLTSNNSALPLPNMSMANQFVANPRYTFGNNSLDDRQRFNVMFHTPKRTPRQGNYSQFNNTFQNSFHYRNANAHSRYTDAVPQNIQLNSTPRHSTYLRPTPPNFPASFPSIQPFVNPVASTSNICYELTQAEDRVNTNYLISIINKQAEQLQAAGLNYQQPTMIQHPHFHKDFTQGDILRTVTSMNLGVDHGVPDDIRSSTMPQQRCINPEAHNMCNNNFFGIHSTTGYLPESIRSPRNHTEDVTVENSNQIPFPHFPHNQMYSGLVFPHQHRLTRKLKPSETYIPTDKDKSNIMANGKETEYFGSPVNNENDKMSVGRDQGVSLKSKLGFNEMRSNSNKENRIVSLSDYTEDSISIDFDYDKGSLSKHLKPPKNMEFPKTLDTTAKLLQNRKFR